ncbi:multidrug resistance protein [Thermoplasmatales archaeon]|nr:multidrug resistance protein [Thermoplasmatales archaeon]
MESQQKRSRGFIVGYNLIYLGVNYLWISFETLILPIQIGSVVPESEMGLFLGIVASLGSFSGIVGNISSGVLSDRFRIGRGKRSPYIFIGIVLVAAMLIGESFFSPSLYEILAGYIVLQSFSNMAIGSTQPILAEIESHEQRGTSAGLNGLFTLIGAAMGFGVTSYFLNSPYRNGDMYALAAGIIITGLATIYTIRKVDSLPAPEKMDKLPLRMIRRPPRDMRKFSGLATGSFFVFMGITGLTFFELYFFKQVLDIPNPATYVAIAGILVLAVSAVASITLGHFSGRIGRWNILVADAIIAAVPTVLIPYFRTFYIFLILGSFIGAAYGTFYSVSYALASDLVPKGETGKYMALFNLSLTGASTISPLIYGLILYLLRASVHLGYVGLFSAAGSFYVAGAAILFVASRR